MSAFLTAVGLSALILAVPVLVWMSILTPHPDTPAGRWLVLFVPLIPVVAWALSPCGVELEGGELRILRRAWRAASYPLAQVEQVRRLPPRWMLGTWKTMGNGGLFGYYGWFYRQGPVRMFASRGDRLVELVVGGGRIVVSPDDPERFVEALLATAPGARVVPA